MGKHIKETSAQKLQRFQEQNIRNGRTSKLTTKQAQRVAKLRKRELRTEQ